MFCCKCGKQLPEGSAFCFHCGNPVGAPAAPVQPVAPAQVAPPAAPVQPAQPPVQAAPPVAPVQPVQPPVAPAAPVVQVAPPVTPINFNTPAADAEAGATTALAPDQAPGYVAPPSADEADAGATTALTPDQAPGYMAPQPAQPMYPPYAPPMAAAPAPKKRNNALLICIIAIVAVIAVTVGALWATGALDDLFGGTSAGDKDDEGDGDKAGEGQGEGEGEGEGQGKGTTSTSSTTTTTANGSVDAIVTQTPDAPVTTQPQGSDSLAIEYNKGYINGSTYFNYWADLVYFIDTTWENGSDADYNTYNGGNTECGLYLKRMNEATGTNEQFAICFEKLPYSDYSEADYVQSVTSQIKTQYDNLGLTVDIGDTSTIVSANKQWQEVSLSLNDGALYQRFLATKKGDYMIVITISSADRSVLDTMLFNMSIS